MRFALALTLTLLTACTDAGNECVTPQGCGDGLLCVQNRCVGSEVEGDPRALYEAEFALRLDAECGVCHFAGAYEIPVGGGDGRYRLHSGVGLSAAQLEENWNDLQDFVRPGDPVNSLLLTYGRGEASIDPERDGRATPHPAVYGTVENLSYARVLNWLSLFPAAQLPDLGLPPPPSDASAPTMPGDPPPPPPPSAEETYLSGIHGVLARGCACHTSPARAWAISAAASADVASFQATRAWITPAAPDQSPLLQYARGELGHSAGAVWAPGEPEYELVLRWIATVQ